ncbi:hypothetical protein Bra1253DRAFT_06007 [Bradyrhizobium sp. WSM1253]|nr:hypothetical protein Bra1253DRAFT_06007 [Bradyrhizobium sp. WSM1253]
MVQALGYEFQKEPSDLLGRIMRVAGENDSLQFAGLLVNRAHDLRMAMAVSDDPTRMRLHL